MFWRYLIMKALASYFAKRSKFYMSVKSISGIAQMDALIAFFPLKRRGELQQETFIFMSHMKLWRDYCKIKKIIFSRSFKTK